MLTVMIIKKQKYKGKMHTKNNNNKKEWDLDCITKENISFKVLGSKIQKVKNTRKLRKFLVHVFCFVNFCKRIRDSYLNEILLKSIENINFSV